MPLNTQLFLDNLLNKGYSHFCTVPCSFAKNLINAVINSKNIIYVPCASEAVACSIAAGLKMSGKKPLVMVQSSGLTNMGSCITSLLKPYDIQIPILVSWRTYKEGDSEIQHQHLAKSLPNLIEAYGYKHIILNQDDEKEATLQLEKCNQENIICLLKKGTFSKIELLQEHQIDLSKYPLRSEYLKALNKDFQNKDTIFIGTTGHTAREMYTFMDKTNNFYMAGNMGGALSLGLGASLASKNVIVCGGDAEFVMHMGGLATAGRYASEVNLTYILFDNESNKSTGKQDTEQKHLKYLDIVRASGFTVTTETIKNISDFIKAIAKIQNTKGLRFFHVKCDNDKETPRPPLDIVKVKEFKNG